MNDITTRNHTTDVGVWGTIVWKSNTSSDTYTEIYRIENHQSHIFNSHQCFSDLIWYHRSMNWDQSHQTHVSRPCYSLPQRQSHKHHSPSVLRSFSNPWLNFYNCEKRAWVHRVLDQELRRINSYRSNRYINK